MTGPQVDSTCAPDLVPGGQLFHRHNTVLKAELPRASIHNIRPLPHLHPQHQAALLASVQPLRIACMPFSCQACWSGLDAKLRGSHITGRILTPGYKFVEEKHTGVSGEPSCMHMHRGVMP